MPADKGGLWVEDKLISGFNPVKTDTLFSLSPPRWSSWIGRVVPSPPLLRTAGSLSSQRPGADETTYTDLRIWHFISRKNTLDTRMYLSEVMWPVLLFSVRKRLFDLEADYVFIRDLQVPKINPGRGDMKPFQTVCYCLFSDICSNMCTQTRSKFFKHHLLIDMEILPDHAEVRSID